MGYITRPTSPTYDIDWAALPDPMRSPNTSRLGELELSPDLLMRASYWIFLYANEHSKQREGALTQINARQDAYALLQLGTGLHLQDRIIIRKDTLHNEYIPRSTYHRSVTFMGMSIITLALCVVIVLFTYTMSH